MVDKRRTPFQQLREANDEKKRDLKAMRRQLAAYKEKYGDLDEDWGASKNEAPVVHEPATDLGYEERTNLDDVITSMKADQQAERAAEDAARNPLVDLLAQGLTRAQAQTYLDAGGKGSIEDFKRSLGIESGEGAVDYEVPGEPLVERRTSLTARPFVPVQTDGSDNPNTAPLSYEQYRDLLNKDPQAAIRAVKNNRVQGMYTNPEGARDRGFD